MTESELYREPGVLTKDKSKWEANIPYVSSLPDCGSVKIKAKALWLPGEMGLLKEISETDSNRVVRIHCLGALKAVSGTGKDPAEEAY